MRLLADFFWYLVPLTIYLFSYIAMRRALKRIDVKPAYSPPGWLISVLWLILYMLQGTAGMLLLRHTDDAWTYELTLLCVHFGLSFLYGPVFSRQNNKFTFFYTFVLFSYSAVVVGFLFKKYAWSGWLFLPTVIWLCFATWLSFSTYQNKRYFSASSSRKMSDEENWVSNTSDEETNSDDDTSSIFFTSQQGQLFTKRRR